MARQVRATPIVGVREGVWMLPPERRRDSSSLQHRSFPCEPKCLGAERGALRGREDNTAGGEPGDSGELKVGVAFD